MIPRIHGTRSTIGATLAYFERETAPGQGRVADIGFIELPPGLTLDTAGRIMLATVREQSRIKALRGISARGRPTREPYYHLSLSWHPDERPPRPVVEKAVEGALAALGLAGHQAIWCAHSDTDHFHVHIMTSRIAWETGRTVRMSMDRRKLSAWALAHEKQHGGVQVETRVKREAWRAEGRDLRQQREGAIAHGDTIAIGDLSRAMADHRRAWPTAERTRGPGREARSAEDREEWNATFACQRAQPDADPADLRRERVRLSRKQGRRRRLKKRVAQAGDVVGRVSRVAKELAARTGAGAVSGAVEIVGGASRVGRVGGAIARFAGHELVGGASRVGRVGTAIVGLGGALVLAGAAKVAADTLSYVAHGRGRGRTTRDILEEERRRRPWIRTLETPALVLSGPLGTGGTPARTQESLARTDSATECVEPAAAQPAAAMSTRAEPAIVEPTPAWPAPEPPPTRPVSAREAARLKDARETAARLKKATQGISLE